MQRRQGRVMLSRRGVDQPQASRESGYPCFRPYNFRPHTQAPDLSQASHVPSFRTEFGRVVTHFFDNECVLTTLDRIVLNHELF